MKTNDLKQVSAMVRKHARDKKIGEFEAALSLIVTGYGRAEALKRYGKRKAKK